MVSVGLGVLATKPAVLGALGLKAGSIGAGLLSGAAVTLGGILDTRFIFKGLLYDEPEEGAVSNDVRVTRLAYGDAINFALGTQCKVSGNVIWQSEPEIIRDSQNSGDKGGPSGNFTTYRKRSNFAIYFADMNPGRTAKRLLKMWFNGKLVYDVVNELDVTDTGSVLTMSVTSTYRIDPTNPTSTTSRFDDFITLHSPSGGPDLSLFRAGQDFLMEGWTTATRYNDVKRITRTTKNPQTGETTLTFADRVNRPAATIPDFEDISVTGATIRIYQPALGFSEKQFSAVRFYGGDEDQQPDPAYVADIGSSQIPAYRNGCTAFVQDYDHHDAGNSFPNIEALIQFDDDDFTAGDAINVLMERYGFARSEYRGAETLGAAFRCYAIAGPQEGSRVLPPLLQVYDAIYRQEGSRIVFYKRNLAPTLTIDPDHLGVIEMGARDSALIPHRVSDRQPRFRSPTKVFVSYLDEARDMETDTRHAQRRGLPYEHHVPLRFPIGMTATRARRLAERTLWSIDENARALAGSLPPSYLPYLLENTNLKYDAQGVSWEVQTRGVRRTVGWVLRFEGVREDPTIHTQGFAA